MHLVYLMNLLLHLVIHHILLVHKVLFHFVVVVHQHHLQQHYLVYLLVYLDYLLYKKMRSSQSKSLRSDEIYLELYIFFDWL